MNVVCSRCSTRYEFDDALVSRRGTSVKCTNCGHKFRIHPPSGTLAGLPDEWIIRSKGGKAARFETLRDLQRALNDGSVTVADEISRDGKSFRPIHSVPELESFFPQGKDRQGNAPSTLVGLNTAKRPSEIPRPQADGNVRSGRSSPPDYDDEDDVTAVYSTEQLEKLRPMRSVPPASQGGGSLKSAEPNKGSAPTLTSQSKTPAGPPYFPKAAATPSLSASTPKMPPLAQPRSDGPSPLGSAAPAPKVAAPTATVPALTPSVKPLGGPAPILPTSRAPGGTLTSALGASSILGGSAAGLPSAPVAKQPAASTTSSSSGSLHAPISSPKPLGPQATPLAGTPTIALGGAQERGGGVAVAPIHSVAVGTPSLGAASSSVAPTASKTDASASKVEAAAHHAAPAVTGALASPAALRPLRPTAAFSAMAPEPKAGPAQEAVPAAASAVASAALAANLTAPSAEPQRAPEAVPARGSDASGLQRRGRRNLTGEDGLEAPGGALPAAELGAPAKSGFDDLDLDGSVPAAPRSNLRWVGAVLLLAGVGAVAVVFGRDYFDGSRDKNTAGISSEGAGVAANPQIDALLQAGHESFRQGDLAAAKAQFAQASELSKAHPGVVAATLLLEVSQCEVSWLTLRLLKLDATENAAAQNALQACGPRLQALADSAAGLPKTPELRALLIDGQRLRGQLAEARSLAAGLSGSATEPQVAYALAMLDAADEAPSWSTVIERLRLASGGERAPGRASAALVYALTRAADLNAAKVELERMEASPRKHPLLPQLRAFVLGSEAAPPNSAELSAAGSAEAPSGDVPAGGEEPGGGVPAAGDPLELARAARQAGDLKRAERHYQEALQLEPGNVTALTGLGDVARARGNSVAALSHYHAALRASGQHLPALAGVADINWAEGDKAEAVKYYRRIGPGNAFSARAQQRIAEHEGRASTPPPASAQPPREATPPTEAQPPPEQEAPTPPKPSAEAPPPAEVEEPAEEAPVEEAPAPIPGPAPKDNP